MVDNQNVETSVKDIKNKVSNITHEQRWALSCYIPCLNIFVCVLAMIRMINDNYVIHHSKQGVILFIFWLSTLFIGLVSPSISLLLLGIVLFLHFLGLSTAYKKSVKEVPIISSLSLKVPVVKIFKLLTGKLPENSISAPKTTPSNQNPTIINSDQLQNIESTTSTEQIPPQQNQ